MRVGLGFDVHPFTEEDQLILGGVTIPYRLGLSGHSDADVLVHALMDAILGALGRGDIGQLFPPGKQKYKNIDSLLLLDRVVKLMFKDEYIINNADMIIIAEAPSIAPYREDIIGSLAGRLKTGRKNLNLKATTTERLGFTGRGEGIASQVIVSLINK